VSAEQALRGVTIEAAYSLKLEDEVGTISPGKRANFTVLTDSPLSVDPLKIRDITVWGTVMEGRVLPAVQRQAKRAEVSPAPSASPEFPREALRHALKVAHAFD
jgi:adenine deaminase